MHLGTSEPREILLVCSCWTNWFWP